MGGGLSARVLSVSLSPPKASTTASAARRTEDSISLASGAFSVVAASSRASDRNSFGPARVKAGALTIRKSWVSWSRDSGTRSPGTRISLSATARGVETWSDNCSAGGEETRIIALYSPGCENSPCA